MADEPPLQLSLPRTRTLDGLLAQLARALQDDRQPLSSPALRQLMCEVVEAQPPDSFATHLGTALTHPGAPVHPFCMLALYEELLPRLGREMGLAPGVGVPPARWLPPSMPRTRQVAATWQRYAFEVLGELERALARPLRRERWAGPGRAIR